MHSKSDNIEVITYDNANKVIEEILNHFFQDTKLIWKDQWKGAILFLIRLNYCITNVTRQILNAVDHT